MKIIVFLLSLTIVLAAPVLAGPPGAEYQEDEQTLRHFKTVLWPQAYRTQDVELLGQLLHDSFQDIGGSTPCLTNHRILDIPCKPSQCRSQTQIIYVGGSHIGDNPL